MAFIGLLLAVLGGAFVAILGRGYLKAKETLEWEEVPAVILVSSIKERRIGPTVPVEFGHEIIYAYQFDGESYQGERTGRRENGFYKDASKLGPVIEEYPVGSKVTAFVNPESPGEAVLRHETRAPGYSIWFPGLFVVGGLGVFFGAMVKVFRKG